MPASQPLPEPDEALPLIRASELTQFSFCQRAWWLSNVKQIPGRNQAVLKHGTQIHRLHTKQVHAALRWRQASFFLLAGGGLLLSMALLLYFLQ